MPRHSVAERSCIEFSMKSRWVFTQPNGQVMCTVAPTLGPPLQTWDVDRA